VRRSCALALVLATLLPAGTAARNPWRLRCPSMPREQRVPPPVRPAARAFFPWARRSAEYALRAGPVYLLALSSRSAIARDGDDSDGAGNDLHRALVAVAPTYPKRVTLTGRRLGRRGPHTVLAFSTNGASHCKVSRNGVECHPHLPRETRSLRLPPRPGWRVVATELVIPLAVPGPDWRG
jgi:hypothetical protein